MPCDELLRVKVMDFDRFSSDEVMGEVEIDLMEEVAKVGRMSLDLFLQFIHILISKWARWRST